MLFSDLRLEIVTRQKELSAFVFEIVIGLDNFRVNYRTLKYLNLIIFAFFSLIFNLKT